MVISPRVGALVDDARGFIQKAVCGMNAGDVKVGSSHYRKRSFISALHYQLEVELFDPEKAQIIAESFKRNLQPLIEKSDCCEIEKWVLKYAPLMGAMSHGEIFEGLEGDPLFQKYPENFKGFFEEIQSQTRALYPPNSPQSTEKRNIVIITKSIGEEPHQRAQMLSDVLNKLGHDVTIIEDDEKDEPIFQVSEGKISSENIYTVLSQTEEGYELALRLGRVANRLQGFIPDQTMQILKKKVYAAHPDLILTTSPFSQMQLAADFGVQVRLVSEYLDESALGEECVPALWKVNPKWYGVWMTGSDRSAEQAFKERLEQQVKTQDNSADLTENKFRSLVIPKQSLRASVQV